MNISHRLQLSAEALAEILIHGAVGVDTAMAAMEAGLDLRNLVALGALTEVECDRLLEDSDDAIFDLTPSGYSVVDDDDGSIH